MYQLKMESWLQQILITVTHSSSYYLLIMLIACVEGIVLLGIVIPGSILCISVGVLAANGHGDLWLSCLAAGIGAIIGDLTSYVVGSRGGHQLVNRIHSPRKLKFLRYAELFFANHGGKSLLFARFFGPLRGSIPFIAGSLRYSPRNSLIFSIISGILWGVIYPAFGYYGGVTWNRFHLSVHATVVIICSSIVVAFLIFAWQRKKKF